MNAFALHAPTDRTALRWIGSAVVIIAIHAGLIAAGIYLYREQVTAGTPESAIMIDMAPAAAAPAAPTQDAAPGPEMTQADAPSEPPPPEPMPQQQVEEQIPPTPQMENPAVEAPPEQKVEPTPPPPEPVKPTPEPPKPIPEPPKPKPKPVRTEVIKKKPSVEPAQPRTTAPPSAQRQASTSSAAMAGASRAASVSYNQLIAAQLQRYKQYPSASKAANEQGSARISFTLDRNGRLLSSRLTKSSGHPALDAETLAVVRRAQPFPPFPSEKIGNSDSFDVPIGFYLR
jgi:protein TonB